jgi:hypothetical protein
MKTGNNRKMIRKAKNNESENFKEVAALLKQPLDKEGFMQSANVRHRLTQSLRKGIFFVGTCHDDILTLFTTKMSLHHLGLKDVLSYAKLLDQTPQDLCLIGIQPEKMEMEMQLSETIHSKINELTNLVLQKLKIWDINYQSIGS